MTIDRELLGPLADLVGSWVGGGHGHYPTIESFDYDERVTFTALPGKPIVEFSQRTRAVSDRRPLHAESGYLRWLAPLGRIELVVAQPTGIVEVASGEHVEVPGHGPADSGWGVELAGEVAGTPTSVDVTSVRRRFTVTGDEWRYELAMGVRDIRETPHLLAVLRRAPAG